MPATSYQCTLCDHAPFKAPTALGRHKLSAHGIPGQSTASVAYRKAKAKAKENLQNGNAQVRHAVKAPKDASKETRSTLTRSQKASLEAFQVHDNQIPDGALAVALGRFQELCRSFAFEYDLPPRLFTSRLTQLISASSVR